MELALHVVRMKKKIETVKNAIESFIEVLANHMINIDPDSRDSDSVVRS